MPIFGAKSRAMRGCASKLACGRRIGPAERNVFTVIFGKFATAPTIIQAGTYGFAANFRENHCLLRADRVVRPYANFGKIAQNRIAADYFSLNRMSSP